MKVKACDLLPAEFSAQYLVIVINDHERLETLKVMKPLPGQGSVLTVALEDNIY